jgi:hypothetical protein
MVFVNFNKSNHSCLLIANLKTMKKVIHLLLLAGMSILAACSSTYHAGHSAQDDVYYSSKNDVQAVTPASTQQYSNASPGDQQQYNNYPSSSGADYGTSTSNGYSSDAYSGNNGTGYPSSSTGNADYANSTNSTADYASSGSSASYVTNNYYYSQDDYYDYAYTARMRRFYNPYYGYSYYDPIYTNNYWYDYNPVNWGVSIYSGYSWWAPSYCYYSPFAYSPGITFGVSIGWGVPCYSNWYYPSFYSPWSYGCGYYGNGWGYNGWGHHGYYNGYNNGYLAGYNQGYYDGSWGLSNPYYYNSYDGNFHYGPRGSSVGGNTPRPNSSQAYGSGKVVSSVGDKYTIALDQGKVTRPNSSFTTTPVSGKSTDLNEVRPSGKSTFNQSGNDVKSNIRPSGIERPGTASDNGNRNSTVPAINPSRSTSGFDDRNTPQVKDPSTVPARPDVFQGQEPLRNNNTNFNQSAPATRPNYSSPSRNNTPSQGGNFDQEPSRNNSSYPSKSYETRPQEPIRNQGAPAQQESGRNTNGGRNNNFFSGPRNDQPPVKQNDQWRNNDKAAPSYSAPSKNFSQPAPERNSPRPGMEMPRSREEQRSPTFQPRNEPKQFSQPGRRR